MAWHEALDLEYWFINVLSGTPEIFTFIAFMAIAGMAAYFRMLNSITLLMFALFAIIMAEFIGGIYLIAILIAGLVMFYYFSKIVKG